MTSREIRQQFLDFFQSKGHLIVSSAPLVAKNDPTLMFNNSGMAQFKDFFLGNGTPPAKRVADTQKCLRVSGKHNDLEDVGFDTYHHTMFEMLGNWSFGDYFKKDALEWSWELLTEVFKLPKDRIYVSVFQGDEKDGVPFDQESWDIWKGIVGDESRIILGNKKDNFWEMGDTGPCGPCSEIHIDLRSPDEVAQTSGRDLVNADHPQVVEIWNNVFMQFERVWKPEKGGALELALWTKEYKGDNFKEDRARKHHELTTLIELPARHVDTGMGFERLCMAIQGKQSNYDTDVFSGTIAVIEKLSGKVYTGKMEKSDVAMRVIADHIRAVSFAIADGLVPSNAKAGYVIRRILRRAIRYGYSYLGFTEPFMNKLVPILADQFDGVFTELKVQQDFVATVIREEESAFLRTLSDGIEELMKYLTDRDYRRWYVFEVAKMVMSSDPQGLFDAFENERMVYGGVAFKMNDTYGFPLDLTELIAKENGWSVDTYWYDWFLEQQKVRSRKDSVSSAGDWINVDLNHVLFIDKIDFVGYDQTEVSSQIVKYRKVQNKQGTQFQIVIDPTPFYAESGGQIGDTGKLELTVGDSQKIITVVDTKKENDLSILISNDKDIDSLLETATAVTAKVDASRRTLTSSNHSATHLLHAALRDVLGTHVAQKGSYVGPDALRFDFSHFSKMTDAEVQQVETAVNQKIRENIALDEKRNVPINEAKGLGATALFGEKYGDFVRVITFDPAYSVELCGGTHVPATGQIGLFKLTSEGSVSTGIRRIEAKTSEGALALLNEQGAILEQLRDLVKAPSAAAVVKAVQALQDERNALQKKIESLENEKVQQVKEQLLTKVQAVNGHYTLVEQVSVPSADALKQLAYDLKAKVDNLALVLGADINGKPQLAVMLPDSLITGKGMNAGQVVKDLAKNIKGGGGGQPFFATAGGSDVSGLAAALEQGRALLG